MNDCPQCKSKDIKFVWRANVKESANHEERLYWQKNWKKQFECWGCKYEYQYWK